ncbi:MAG: hypothetical protein CMP22_00480 [Rickettsiales bacterium]|nr:hypothetical protein [Rickettsiales bacterium]
MPLSNLLGLNKKQKDIALNKLAKLIDQDEIIIGQGEDQSRLSVSFNMKNLDDFALEISNFYKDQGLIENDEDAITGQELLNMMYQALRYDDLSKENAVKLIEGLNLKEEITSSAPENHQIDIAALKEEQFKKNQKDSIQNTGSLTLFTSLMFFSLPGLGLIIMSDDATLGSIGAISPAIGVIFAAILNPIVVKTRKSMNKNKDMIAAEEYVTEHYIKPAEKRAERHAKLKSEWQETVTDFIKDTTAFDTDYTDVEATSPKKRIQIRTDNTSAYKQVMG